VKSLKLIGGMVTIGLALCIVAGIAWIGVDLRLVAFLQTPEESRLEAEAQRLDALTTDVGVASNWINFATAVCFLIWFARAHRNLIAGGLARLEYSPTWAVIGFFVPILGLFRPYQVMQEVWRGSSFLSGASAADMWQRLPKSGLVTAWWWAFLLSTVAGTVVAVMHRTGEQTTVEELRGVQGTVISTVLYVAAGVLLIVIVRRVTRFQSLARTQTLVEVFQ
jgi:hypothetical protein